MSPPPRLGLSLRTRAPADPHPAHQAHTLKSIGDLAGRTALWRQPSQLRQEYELVVGEDTVATLRWRKNVGTTAVARSPDGTWSFKASGFLSPRVTLRLPNSDFDFAVFRPRATGEGVLEPMAGQHFTWRCVNFWQNAWAFFDGNGARLLQIRPEDAQPKVTGAVTIDPHGADCQETGYLVALGWYLLVLMAEDAAAGPPPQA